MSTNPPSHPAPPRKRSHLVVYIIILVILFVAGKRFQSDREALNSHMEQMAEQNSQLQQALKVAEEQINQLSTGDRRTLPANGEERPARITSRPKAPDPETLLLSEPVVSQTPNGIVTRFSLESTVDVVPDLIALVVRVPSSTPATITRLEPVESDAFSSVKGRIDASGKFAVFQGTPEALESLDFSLEVSEQVTAIVRGSKGIRPFAIDIAPGGATVRKLDP